MTSPITLEDAVAVAPGQIAADLGGEIVLLSIATGVYFGLNEVAARIWELIGEPCCVQEVRDQLLIDYPEVDTERYTVELLAVLGNLQEARLVRISQLT